MCLGQVNQGRISTYKAELYTPHESVDILNNIVKWYDMTVTWFDNKAIMLPSVFSIISRINAGSVDELFLQYTEAIIRGKWSWLLERFLLPHLRTFDNRFTHYHYLKGVINLTGELCQNNTDETVDFMAGRLLATAYLLEMRIRYLNESSAKNLTIAQMRMEEYKKKPYKSWIGIREQIQMWEGEKDGDVREIVKIMQKLETDLAARDIRNVLRLSAEFYIGFDVQTQEYWDWKNQRIVEYYASKTENGGGNEC